MVQKQFQNGILSEVTVPGTCKMWGTLSIASWYQSSQTPSFVNSCGCHSAMAMLQRLEGDSIMSVWLYFISGTFVYPMTMTSTCWSGSRAWRHGSSIRSLALEAREAKVPQRRLSGHGDTRCWQLRIKALRSVGDSCENKEQY